jgi:hypothetical protein
MVAIGEKGWLSGFWCDGNIVLEAIVFITNLKILVFSSQYSILLVFVVVGSIGMFFLFYYLFNLWIKDELYGSFMM